MKKLIIIAGILFFSLGSFVSADTSNFQSNFYYVFHLYYDTGKLVPDRDFKFSYDIIPGDFVQSPVATQFPYRGEVINMAGQISGRFIFDPKSGNPNLTKGKIAVNAPYVADAQKVVFYDNQNQPALTISVSQSSFCNDDGICNADRGENSLNCPIDCKQASLPAASLSPTPTTTSTGSSSLLSGIIYAVIGIILAGLVWLFFRRRKNSGNITFPPVPPAPLSTPARTTDVVQSGGPPTSDNTGNNV